MEINVVSPLHQTVDDVNKANGEVLIQTISTLNRCKTVNASQLVIYDVLVKLKQGGDFDIGGTYGIFGDSDFWFLMKTTVIFGNNYLLNLYVMSVNTVRFSIGISDTNELRTFKVRQQDHYGLMNDLAFYTFKANKKNQLFYIKTFTFPQNSFSKLESKLLFIPIKINTNVSNTINVDVVNCIKVKHNVGLKLQEVKNKDFKLISNSGEEFCIHRIVLAAHSPIFRDLVEDPNITSHEYKEYTSAEISLLVEFLYSGNIQNIDKVDCTKLIMIAYELKIHSMLMFMQDIVSRHITTNNVIEIALMTEGCDLKTLQKQAFKFIKDNPSVLKSDSWRDFDNASLAKKLFEYVHGC